MTPVDALAKLMWVDVSNHAAACDMTSEEWESTWTHKLSENERETWRTAARACLRAVAEGRVVTRAALARTIVDYVVGRGALLEPNDPEWAAANAILRAFGEVGKR